MSIPARLRVSVVVAIGALTLLAGCATGGPDAGASSPAPEVQLSPGQQGPATCPELATQVVVGGELVCSLGDEASRSTFGLALEIVDPEGAVAWQLVAPDGSVDAWFQDVTGGAGTCPPLATWTTQLAAGGQFLCTLTDDATGANIGLAFTVVDAAGELTWKFSA